MKTQINKKINSFSLDFYVLFRYYHFKGGRLSVRWDWSKDPGPTTAGSYPATSFAKGGVNMSNLSVFIDESGFFSLNKPHSPYYLVTLLLHDQSVDISANISKLNIRLNEYGLPNHTIHTAPLIRNEGLYKNMTLYDRNVFSMHYTTLSEHQAYAIIQYLLRRNTVSKKWI